MSLLIKQGKKTQCSNIIDLTFDILNLKVSLFTKKEFDKINNFYIEPKIYLKEKPNYIINQGDTNTVLASSIACNKLNYRKDKNKNRFTLKL